MVYKKYIKKDGKLYGPYLYESKRINGKVVSEYHGSKKRIIDLKKFIWIFVSAVFVLFLAYFLSTFDFSGLTGQAVLNAHVNYTANQPIKGNLSLALKQGELIPSSSKLIIENSGQSYEYNLNELVSNQPVSGNFYIEGISLSGAGEGYGIEGEKKVYPDVFFVLEIYPVNQTEIVNISEPALNESVNHPENPSINPPSANETASENTTVQAAPENESGEASPITGFFIRIYNFFLALTPTGKAIAEGSSEINGQTSFNNPFVFDISGGEGVQLKPGSASVLGAGVSDDNVQISVNANQVVVETSYSEIQKGFGREYLGTDTEILNIDLSALGLVLNDGELITKIVYGNKEIISANIMLTSGVAKSNLTNISNTTVINVTIEQPVNNTLNNTIDVIFGEKVPQIITADTVKFILTEEDKALLLEEYGDVVVQTSKSEIINGKLVKRYQIGNDWIEYSYDISASEEQIGAQMSLDMMKWLKDLVQRIRLKKQAAQQAQPQPVENFSFQ